MLTTHFSAFIVITYSTIFPVDLMINVFLTGHLVKKATIKSEMRWSHETNDYHFINI